MLTREQQVDLSLFIKRIKSGGQSDDEFLRDSVDEVNAYRLEDRSLEERRDRAVALYYHRLRMMVARSRDKK